MKKEKIIRSYKRKTKSGKVVTVKQHTAKYDAAEEMKKALAKRGAGEELEKKKLTADELKQVKDIVSENSELDEQYVAAFYPELSPRMVKAVMAEYRKKSATPQAKAANTAGKTPKPKAEKSFAPDVGFTKEEYKAWYHWDTENDPKNKTALKVKKVLTEKLGAKGYKQYEKEMTDTYTSRGHIKGYSGYERMDSAVASKTAGDAKAPKRPVKSGSSETYKVHYRGSDGKLHTEAFSDKAAADDFASNVNVIPRSMRPAEPKGSKESSPAGLSPKKSQTKVKELNLGGHSYFVWKDSDGSFKGSRQNPTSRVMDANSIARFTYDQGFKSVKDVEDYLKAPYTKGKKKK